MADTSGERPAITNSNTQFRFKKPGRQTRSAARRDAVVLVVICSVTWLLIQQTEMCTRFFAYVAAHPELELDSAILAGIFSTLGLMVFAFRRWAEASRSEASYQELAHQDPLTDLPNRRSFIEAAELATRETDNTFICFLIDLDGFDQVNDLRGHSVGDQLLRTLAQDLGAALPAHGLLARIGGDKFGLLLSLPDATGAIDIAEEIVRVIGEPRLVGRHLTRVSVSIGIASYPADGVDGSSIVRRADIALYRAKAQHNSVLLFETGMEAADRRAALVIAALQEAIPRGEIVPHYQPLIDFKTGQVVGYEVLARWTSPVLGSVSPAEFIAAASQTGLIGDLSYGLFERTCAEAAQWPNAARISFNVTPRLLCDPLLAMRLLAILSKSGLSPQRLDIELTEDALLQNTETAHCNLDMLKRIGVTLTLDDFGTGYSSLHHLRMLPFDKVKIDRSYVGQIAISAKSRLLVEAIINLVHTLGLPTVAEGVETDEEASLLKAMGCDFGQGWLYGRAVSGSDVLRQMKDPDAVFNSEKMNVAHNALSSAGG